jgi:hypothetical protein
MTQFLVTGHYTEPGPLFSPEAAAQMIEDMIIPSLRMLVEWESDGTSGGGGAFTGERAGSFILNAPSSEEAGFLISSLPFWPLLKWEVKPLQSFASAAEQERRVVEQIRALVGPRTHG